MALSKEKILKKLKNNVTVYIYGSIDSTNDEAKRRAQTDSGIRLYAASHQTAGRGRRGRSFYSPADTGLYMTLALPFRDPLEEIRLLTCAAGVAVCEAIEELTDREPKIKWVNDVLIDGKKVAGILAELIYSEADTASAAIIGIGLNLKTENFPEEFADRAGNIGDVDPESLCAAITDKLISCCCDPDYNSLLEKYTAKNICVGRNVTFTLDGKKITAAAVGIDRDGGLIVDIDGNKGVLNSGEISVVTE